MARRIVLHIGPRKTATTYIQRVIQHYVESGMIAASIYPVRTRGRLDHNQVPGLIDLARSFGEIALQPDAWAQLDGSNARTLIEAVARSDGDVILSAEALSVLRASGASRIVAAFAPTPVDVVITARALGRTLPSSWQQHMRNGNIEAYADYLMLRVEERRSRRYDIELNRGFWRAYRYGELARRWAEFARRVSIVTVPSPRTDADEMWWRFRAASEVAELPIDPPTIDERTANVSLTGAESYMLREINLIARHRGATRRELRSWHQQIIDHCWIEREDRGSRLGLPEEMIPVVQRWAHEDIDDLASLDLPIFGSLDDLMVPSHTSGTPEPAAVADAAAVALLWLVRLGEQDGAESGSPPDPADRQRNR